MSEQPPDMAKLVKHYQLTYAMCRNFGHPWEFQTDERRTDGGWDRHLYCPRCTMSRIQALDPRGYPMGNSYPDKPKDYAIPGLPWDAAARAAFRLGLQAPRIRRAIGQIQQRQ